MGYSEGEFKNDVESQVHLSTKLISSLAEFKEALNSLGVGPKTLTACICVAVWDPLSGRSEMNVWILALP